MLSNLTAVHGGQKTIEDVNNGIPYVKHIGIQPTAMGEWQKV